jgi:hypothetical protein
VEEDPVTIVQEAEKATGRVLRYGKSRPTGVQTPEKKTNGNLLAAPGKYSDFMK